jgi:hypothetical protein
MFDHDLCIQKTFSSQIPLKGETEKGPSLRNKESQDSDELVASQKSSGRNTSFMSRTQKGQRENSEKANTKIPAVDAAAIPGMVAASRAAPQHFATPRY